MAEPINLFDRYHTLWLWTEAFTKFGFNEGKDDGLGRMMQVVNVLETAGYTVEYQDTVQLHNSIILSIARNGLEILNSYDIRGFEFSDDPITEYFPQEIITLLDKNFKHTFRGNL